MGDIIHAINYYILIYFAISVVIYTALLLGAFPDIVYYFKRGKFARIHELLDSSMLPPVTVIIPAYNEHENIHNAVQSALNSSYKNLFVFVMNDASTDDTLEILHEHYQLREVPVTIEQRIPASNAKRVFISEKYPQLLVIDKEHGGAGDSINVGINACFTPYFITFDADSIMDKFAIDELMYEVLTHDRTIAVGGGVYILNACQFKDGVMLNSRMPYTPAPAIQSCEYMRSHLFNRTGWNTYGGTVSYSGTATLFQRTAVIAAGGFDTKNYAQDCEIILRLHKYMHKHKIPYRIRFNPACAVWTDVPATFREFAVQRDHWRRGLLRSVIPYLSLFMNPRYGEQGLVSYPLFIFLEILAPPVEFLSYLSLLVAYCFGILDVKLAILFILLAWGFTSYITMANMFLNLVTFNRYKKLKDIAWMFLLCFLEMFGYRQFYVLVNVWGSLHFYFNRLRGRPL